MTILDTGNVGIGTTSPQTQLEIRNNEAGNGVGGATLRLTRGDATSVAGDPVGTIEFYSTDADTAKVTAYIKSMSEELYGREGSLAFGVSQTINADATEAMRIDSNGNLSVVGRGSFGNYVVSSDFGAAYNISLAAGTTARGINMGYNATADAGFIGVVHNGTGWKNLSLQPISGNVGIGETNPSSTNYWAQADNLVVRSGAHTGITIKSSTTTNGNIVFTDTNSSTAGFTDGGALMYNHATDSMQFRTSGAERLRINSSGNVGIGTTSPTAAKLNVVGAVNVTGGAIISGSDTNVNVGVAIGIGKGLYSNDGNYLRKIIEHTSGGDIAIGQGGTSLIGNITFQPGSSGDIKFYPSGGQDVTFASSGNVGIGTDSPAAKLEVDTNLAGEYGTYIHNQSSTGKGLLVKTNSDTSSDPVLWVGRNNQNPSLFVGGGANGGNVGIGTDSPGNQLHVYNTGNGEVKIERASGAQILLQAQAAAGVVGTNSNHDLDLKTNGSTRVKIENSGNVGIGTTSPANKLTVEGDIGFVGYLGQGSIYGNTGNSSYARVQLYDPATGYTTFNNISYGYYFQTGGGTKMTILNNGNVGIGTTSPGVSLDVVGAIRATGDVTAYYSSDERLKDNKKVIENAVNKINKINGYEFDWVPKEGVHTNEGHDIGIMAQEVEKILPEIVITRDNGYKAVKYEKLVPLLIEAIKELSDKVKALENK
jgi:hypothetical protein